MIYVWPPAVHRFLSRDRSLYEIMERLVMNSKVLEWPGNWTRDMTNLYFAGLPASIILGYALTYVNPLLEPAGGAIVVITYFLPWVKAADYRASLKRDVELELPVVSLVLWGLSEIGYDVMRMVSSLSKETEELRAIPREFSKIYRDFTVFNAKPDEAVLRETENHPSKLFERLLGEQ